VVYPTVGTSRFNGFSYSIPIQEKASKADEAA
jgi:hypothetical protein